MLYKKLIENHLEEDSVVLSDGENKYTYRSVHDKVQLFRGFLAKHDVKKEDRVLIWSQNIPETVFAILACIADGIIFVLISDMYSNEMISEIRMNCQPKVEINPAKTTILPTNNAYVRKTADAETGAYIIYTSGTSGKQKGIFAKQKQILFLTQAINERLGNKKGDRIFCMLPLYFDYGLYQIFLALRYGATLYLSHLNILQMLPRYLKELEITAFPALPSIINILTYSKTWENVSLPHLRYITFTGEWLPVSLISELEQQLPDTEIIPMYGLSECKRVSIMPFGDHKKKHLGSCGLPLKGINVYLENPGTNGVGELVVSGPNVMEGYWANKDVQNHVFEENGKVKRLYTGDLFRIDEDGYLYFCGRKNRLLKFRGYRFSGIWLEQRFLRYPEIAECRVCSIWDDRNGESAGIFIYGDKNKTADIIQKEMEELPEYLKAIRIIVRDKAFPRNPNYKINEAALISEWRESQFGI